LRDIRDVIGKRGIWLFTYPESETWADHLEEIRIFLEDQMLKRSTFIAFAGLALTGTAVSLFGQAASLAPSARVLNPAIAAVPLYADAEPAAAPSHSGSFIERYQARVSATQAEQPHWITPLVLVTPRLEQEIRTDFVHQYNPKGFAVWNYGNGKGLELIPERHIELLMNVPPFFNRSNGEQDGFGDISLVGKYRFYARNEEHGNAIVTAFLNGSIPTGKNANGSCCAVITPTLAVGKGFGHIDFTSTAGGTLPVTNAVGLGRSIVWNSVAQYHIAKEGTARFFWPELESNATFYKGGSNDGKNTDFITPGLVIGRIPLSHDAKGNPGRLGLTFGAGEQIAATHFHTYNHATVITMRMPF
jgi:hypothetical protein